MVTAATEANHSAKTVGNSSTVEWVGSSAGNTAIFEVLESFEDSRPDPG